MMIDFDKPTIGIDDGLEYHMSYFHAGSDKLMLTESALRVLEEQVRNQREVQHNKTWGGFDVGNYVEEPLSFANGFIMALDEIFGLPKDYRSKSQIHIILDQNNTKRDRPADLDDAEQAIYDSEQTIRDAEQSDDFGIAYMKNPLRIIFGDD